MPIELQIIRASDFVRLDADEHLNFDQTRKTLQGLAVACRNRGLDRAMLDLRSVPVPEKPLFTTTELAALVGAFREAGFSRHQRLAILYRRDVHGGVRNFTFFSRMRGLHVQAFHRYENAIHWLWERAENLEQKHGANVPILAHDVKRRAADFTSEIHIADGDGPARRFKRNH